MLCKVLLHVPHYSVAPFSGVLNFSFILIYIISVRFSFTLYLLLCVMTLS